MSDQQKENNTNIIIEPVAFNFIKFMDNDKVVGYTDCFEVSLLRFLHCVFVSTESDDNNEPNNLVMDLDRMRTYMLDTQECTQLIDFFTLNQKIEPSEEYYQNEESDGYKLRTDWCVFLNKRSFFRYKKDEKYELCASLNNLYTFFNVFLPKIHLDQPTDKMKLNRLASKLSSDELFLDISLKSKTTDTQTQFYYTNDMFINVNDTKYKWHLYQYFDNVDGSFGDRITGHSELSLC